MFGIGTTEILVILVLALLIIGPSKLPEVARTLGKGMAEFRRMSSDVKKTVDLESKLSEQESQEPAQEADASAGGAAAEKTPEPESEQGGTAASGEGFPADSGEEENKEESASGSFRQDSSEGDASGERGRESGA